jgi:DNA-binding HxlR family transcriptional regulator
MFAMADYGTFCPVAVASDVLADRWTPLIVRELILGNTRFNDIARAMPGISRSLLVQRLKHLERKGVIETWPSRSGRGSEYHLTPAGKDLEPVIMAIGRWAVQWMYTELRASEVDPISLMWWMHRRIDSSQVPHGRVVVQFDHTAPERRSMWLVIERGEASVCLQYPGFDTDVLVTCPTAALANVFSGAESWEHAVRSEAIQIAGPRTLVKALPSWFLWSPWADQMRAATMAEAASSN